MDVWTGTVMTGVTLVMTSPLVAEGLKRILAETFDPVDIAENLEGLTTSLPDAGSVVVVDRAVLGDNLQDSLAQLVTCHPHSRFIVLVSNLDQQEAASSFAAGAFAYFLDDAPYQAFTAVAQLVALGRKVAPSELVDMLSHPTASSARVAKHINLESVGLTEREHLIVEFLALGQPNKAIARELGITESAVKAAVKAVLRKLSVQNRTQAAILVHDAEPHIYLAAQNREGGPLEGKQGTEGPDTDWDGHLGLSKLRHLP